MKKWFYKAFDNYKDIFFACWIILWFILDMVLWQVYDFTLEDMQLVNMGVIAVFAIITFAKFKSEKFYNWLHTPLKKDE
jgi:hypothetical protein